MYMRMGAVSSIASRASSEPTICVANCAMQQKQQQQQHGQQGSKK
jgi:hypothetical protein